VKQSLNSVYKELQKGMEPQAKRMRESIREEMEMWERALEKKYGILMPSKRKTKKK
jgi:hypothetical protein